MEFRICSELSDDCEDPDEIKRMLPSLYVDYLIRTTEYNQDPLGKDYRTVPIYTSPNRVWLSEELS